MADVATVRREARRRRILENSHNRLQLISGKNNDTDAIESANKSPIPQIFETLVTADSPAPSSYSLLNGVLGSEQESSESLPSRHDVVAAGDGEIVSDTAAFGTSPAQVQTEKPLWTTLTIYKYDIVLLSLLLQVVHGLFSIDFDNTYFFLPLIIYTITKLIWFPNQNNSSIINALLLLNGMNPSRLHKMLQFAGYAGTISQDVSIFLFTTICTQSLFTTLNNSFIT